MPDADAKRALLREIETVRRRMDAERRRHNEAMNPLHEEMKPLMDQLAALEVGPRELAKALGMNPRRAKRLPSKRGRGG
jgi:hypothetical protein